MPIKIINKKHKLLIVHINTHDMAGGAAKVAWRLAEAQRNAGHNAKMLVGYKRSTSEHSVSFPVEPDRSFQAKCQREGQLFYEFQGSHKLITNPFVQSADILHLHNLHGWYFNPFSVSALSHAKPVVWTLHDMQSFTGHCAHSFDSEGWLTGCGNCPHLDTEPALPVDTTAQLWKDKKLIYDHSYLWVVTPSQWLKNKVEKSILRNHPTELIYNGIDTNIFRQYSKKEMRSSLGIPEDMFVIGSVAHGGISNQWKGGRETQAALDTLLRTHRNLIFLNIGGTQPNTGARFINTGHITDESLIAQFYSCLDIFIYTPVADNCPLTILEALACGIPIVTFDTGGIPELVRDNSDGFVIRNRSIPDVISAVDKILTDKNLHNTLSANSRDHAVTTFDHKLIAKKYEQLYLKILEKNANNVRKAKLFSLSEVPEIIKTAAFLSAEETKKHLGQEEVGKPTAEKPRGVLAGQMKNYPRISIVTPSFNQGQFLEECIDSILSQNYPNLEYIIMDGGSTDNSVEIIKKYEKYLTYWQSKPDQGQYHAINEGFKKTTGEIMTWLNSDDILHPKSLEKVAGIFSDMKDVEWIMGRPNGIDEQGRQSWILDPLPLWAREKYLKRQYRSPYIQQEGTFWRRTLWERAGGIIDTNWKLAGDLELWARFFRHSQLYSVDALLAAFRKHSAQKTTAFFQEYNNEAEKIIDGEIQFYNLSSDKTLLPAPPPVTAAQLSSLTDQTVEVITSGPADKESAVKVSAIVSTYNSERFMRGCLEDLVGQTLYQKGDLEIIVVDSGSEQNEKSIIEEFRQKYKNVKYIRTKERETVYAAWNRGVKAARGKYITSANTDDRHRKDALEVMALVLDERPDIGLVYADVIITGTENETFEKHTPAGYYRWEDYNREKLSMGCFIGPQPMWRRSLHDKYGYFNETFSASGDWEFWLRVAEDTEFLHIPEFLGLYLRSSESLEHRNAGRRMTEDRIIYKTYIPRYLPAYEEYFDRMIATGLPNRIDIYRYGQILAAFNKYDKAIGIYTSYLQKDPDDRGLAAFLEDMKTLKTQHMLTQAPSPVPLSKEVMAYLNEADRHIADNDLESAREAVKKALHHASGHTQLCSMLSNILISLAEPESADRFRGSIESPHKHKP